MGIGKRIKARRMELKMTQKELAEACGIADSAVRKYESEKIKPKYEIANRLATALGMDIAEMFGFPEAQNKLYSEVALVEDTLPHSRVDRKDEETIRKCSNELRELIPMLTSTKGEELANAIVQINEKRELLRQLYISVTGEEEDKMYARAEILKSLFYQLNESGQRAAIERIEELAEIPRYQAQQIVESAKLSSKGKDTPEE